MFVPLPCLMRHWQRLATGCTSWIISTITCLPACYNMYAKGIQPHKSQGWAHTSRQVASWTYVVLMHLLDAYHVRALGARDTESADQLSLAEGGKKALRLHLASHHPCLLVNCDPPDRRLHKKSKPQFMSPHLASLKSARRPPLGNYCPS